MAIEIPHEVALFLNFLGVPYPDINEDDVHALARHVRTFAASVAETHDSATGAVEDMGSVYSGHSYQQLVTAWARMSGSHMADLDHVCRVVAAALDGAAEVIRAVKVAVLAELAALAASYTAAAAMPGGLLVVEAAVRAAADRICSAMKQMLLFYVLSELIGKAVEPLEHTIGKLLDEVTYDAVRHLLGVPASPAGSASLPLHIETDEVLHYAGVLDDHADDILKHAAALTDKVAELDFTTAPGRFASTDDPQQHSVSTPRRHGGTTVPPGLPRIDVATAPSAPDSSTTYSSRPSSLRAVTGPRTADDSADVHGHVRKTTEFDEPPRADESRTAAAGVSGAGRGGVDPIGPETRAVPDTGDTANAGGEAQPTVRRVATHDSDRPGDDDMPGRHGVPAETGTTRTPISSHPGRLSAASMSSGPGGESASGPPVSHNTPDTNALAGADEPFASPLPPGTASMSAPPTTPWARPKQALPARTNPGRSVEPTPGRASAAPASNDCEPARTPWSKTGRKPDGAAEVFTRATGKTGSAPANGKRAAQQNDSDSTVERETGRTATESRTDSPLRRR